MITPTPHDAASIVLKQDTPIEIEIPRQSSFKQFYNNLRSILRTKKLLIRAANASTEGAQIIYVYKKSVMN